MPVSAGGFDVALEGEICRPRFHWMEKIMRAGSEPSDTNISAFSGTRNEVGPRQ